MIIIPAIDILDGKVVRLYHGDYNQVTQYSLDPVDTAKAFFDMGATRLHVVDLSAAKAKADGSDREQVRTNRNILEKIRVAVPLLIETGGGIRTRDDVSELVDRGIQRLILGTLLAKQPEIAGQWVEEFGKIFIAGIDAKDGEVKISGWKTGVSETPLMDLDLAATAKQIGMISIVYTNISQDGTLMGPDLARTQQIAQVSGLPVILSGGIGSHSHIQKVIEEETKRVTALPDSGRIQGIIVGKAYYEGKVDLPKIFAQYPQIPISQSVAGPQGDW
jgi:phosphoribosylformimino-5-aminoimidazole carboxamide ribotide isomerase